MPFAARLLASAWTGLNRHPARNAGVAAFAVTFTVIAGNALFAQPGSHPAPFLATRVAAPGLDQASVESVQSAALLREVQTLLARTGHYAAVIDGRPGPATSTAIKTFQIENGLAADGTVSEGLVAAIRQVAIFPPEPESRPYLETSEQDGRTGRIVEATDDLEIGDIADVTPIAEASGADLVRRIQAGLSAASVAELSADGIIGEQTRAAIRTFEALEGMDVTGNPDRRILERLVEIGAI